MDFTTIENWLKSSLSGIIFLGAIGSILAVALIRLGRTCLTATGFGIAKWKAREYRAGWEIGVVASYLVVMKDGIHAIFFIAYLLARLIVACVTLLMFTVWLLWLAPKSSPVLSLTTWLLATLACVSLRWVYEEFRDIRAIYTDMLQPIIKTVEEMKAGKEKNDCQQVSAATSRTKNSTKSSDSKKIRL